MCFLKNAYFRARFKRKKLGMKHLLARKYLAELIQEAEENQHGFRRHLSAWNLVLLGVGCIIGAGIFVLTGSAAANFAGPSLIISFLLSALGCAFAGLCYAEFASMIPISGSAYTSVTPLGELAA